MTENQKHIDSFIKTNYPKIKRWVDHKSFTHKVDAGDLMGEVHSRLSNMYVNGGDYANEQLFSYAYQCVTSGAIDLKRKKQRFVPNEISDFDNLFTTEQTDICMKHFKNQVFGELRSQIKNDIHLIVFDEYFVHGAKYEQAAKLSGLPLNTVKTFIRRVRKLANEKYGNRYREVISL